MSQLVAPELPYDDASVTTSDDTTGILTAIVFQWAQEYSLRRRLVMFQALCTLGNVDSSTRCYSWLVTIIFDFLWWGQLIVTRVSL